VSMMVREDARVHWLVAEPPQRLEKGRGIADAAERADRRWHQLIERPERALRVDESERLVDRLDGWTFRRQGLEPVADNGEFVLGDVVAPRDDEGMGAGQFAW